MAATAYTDFDQDLSGARAVPSFFTSLMVKKLKRIEIA
jgi:hypothetical protein